MTDTIETIQSTIRGATRITTRGRGSKGALHAERAGATMLDLRGLSGILEYEAGEYTITARAGTPVAEVAAALAEQGQYLPFDPPLLAQGATLGGTIAAGLSGSGRYRYGGVRDFLIGVRFVDGRGQLVRGGGKVVKNAAGFDLPKLLVGSLGQLGVLVECSFKVFPQPRAFVTVQVDYPTLAAALAGLQQAAGLRMDLEALDIDMAAAPATGATLSARLGGAEQLLNQRAQQLQRVLGSGTVLIGTADAAHWHAAREFTWLPTGWSLVKVASAPGQLIALEQRLAATPAQRHYTVGGNLTWIAWPGGVLCTTTRLMTP